jgi:hypothetical protein
VQDAEPGEALGELGGGLGAAAVGHQPTRQATFLEPLAQAVGEALGVLGEIPLGVTAKA